jgi:hypothetical protein
MGETILVTNLKRKPGYLYYCATDKDGNITLNEALMARGGKSKKKKKSFAASFNKCECGLKIQTGFGYYNGKPYKCPNCGKINVKEKK